MGVHLLIAAAFAADCPDPAALVADTERAVLEARWDDAWDLLDDTEAALGCAPIPTSETLARMWLAEGVLHASTGDDASSDDAFAAAARVDSGVWNPDYGPALRERFEQTIARSPVPGRFELRPPLERFTGFIDGQSTVFPASVPAGLHLVQVGPEGESMRFARLLFLPPGENAVIDHGIDESVPIEPPPETLVAPPAPLVADPAPLRKTPLLVAGGAALAVGLGSAIAATTQNTAMRNATSVDSLEAAYSRQQVFGYTGYSLLGAGGALVGLHFVL